MFRIFLKLPPPPRLYIASDPLVREGSKIVQIRIIFVSGQGAKLLTFSLLNFRKYLFFCKTHLLNIKYLLLTIFGVYFFYFKYLFFAIKKTLFMFFKNQFLENIVKKLILLCQILSIVKSNRELVFFQGKNKISC